MKKIVINTCFGGFGLSPAGIKEWAGLNGRECYFFKDGIGAEEYKRISFEEAEKRMFMSAFDIPNPAEVLNKGNEWRDMTDKQRQDWNALYSKHHLSDRDIPRDDTNLIKVVEKLGKKASGSCAHLEIVEIPEDVQWEINEYDGNEHVAEVHRTWR
jgi:hypothetical protein